MAEKDVKDFAEGASSDQVHEEVNMNDAQQATSAQSQSAIVDSEVEKFRSDLFESKDKYLRLVAEFDNFRRRSAKERIEVMQTAGREILSEMLPVLDDVERAQKQLEITEDVTQIKEGVSLVFNKFRNVLLSKGLKPMETVGKEFDADLHEAVTEIPASSDDMIGKVMDEVSKGYYLNDKIIRHAKVVVGK